MLATEQPFAVDASLEQVWAYVGDMANWAGNLPGYQSFEVLDETDSLWTLKVALGALVRTVRLRIHITEWRAPDHVAFTLTGVGDPIEGQGSFDARPSGDARSEVLLTLAVAGNGQMAGVMESMARPVLPRLGKGLAEALRAEIEQRARASTVPVTATAHTAPAPAGVSPQHPGSPAMPSPRASRAAMGRTTRLAPVAVALAVAVVCLRRRRTTRA
ncbi:SRPBCC family protein [Pseudonocardia sp.]|uniref:CoxG family protein n=1 Tax=Pseudonocardia sp. TaxID=60912 RepID=UPI0026138E74|nr:SRPBCC family protein [Pseudonocardia sp.]